MAAPLHRTLPRIKKEAGACFYRHQNVAVEIGAKHQASDQVVEEDESFETRKLPAFAKDKRRLQSAIGEEQAAAKLRQTLPVFCLSRHGVSLLELGCRHECRWRGNCGIGRRP